MSVALKVPVRFVTTQWQVVRDAASISERERQLALEKLLFQYRPALCDYLCRHFHMDEATAEDYLHAFILDKVLKKNVLVQASRSRGKFRSFLLSVLNGFVIDRFRKESTRAKSPHNGFVSLDSLETASEAVQIQSADSDFDEAIARQVIAECLHETRQYCTETGLEDAWAIFNDRLLRPLFDQGNPTPFENLAAGYGLADAKEARNKLTTAKRIFRRFFDKCVGELLEEDSPKGEEMRHILSIFGTDRAR